jgi:hypothetical protein
MNIVRRFLRLPHLLDVCLAVALGGLVLDSKAVEPGFDQSVASYRQTRYSEAFGRFVTLAARGDADAARIVLFMNQYGPQLYGSYWDLSTEEISDFNRIAASGRNRGQPDFRPPWAVTRK